jgi:hypothetical protein
MFFNFNKTLTFQPKKGSFYATQFLNKKRKKHYEILNETINEIIISLLAFEYINLSYIITLDWKI